MTLPICSFANLSFRFEGTVLYFQHWNWDVWHIVLESIIASSSYSEEHLPEKFETSYATAFYRIQIQTVLIFSQVIFALRQQAWCKSINQNYNSGQSNQKYVYLIRFWFIRKLDYWSGLVVIKSLAALWVWCFVCDFISTEWISYISFILSFSIWNVRNIFNKCVIYYKLSKKCTCRLGQAAKCTRRTLFILPSFPSVVLARLYWML